MYELAEVNTRIKVKVYLFFFFFVEIKFKDDFIERISHLIKK